MASAQPLSDARINSTPVDPQEAARSVEQILTRNRLMTLACIRSVEGKAFPWSCTLFFAFDASLTLYFLSSPAAEHSTALLASPTAAVAVSDSRQKFGPDKQGLQGVGTCHMLSGPELEAGLYAFRTRYPMTAVHLASSEAFEISGWESRLWGVQLATIKVFDERRFGQETWVEARIAPIISGATSAGNG
jgi:uncharacterized protein YhbP (UPF0306 family)